MDQALTDQAHWDNVWHFVGGLRNAAAPRLEPSPITEWIERVCARRLSKGKNFLEVGAGGSPWPAHVAQKFGATAWGIDISRPGLEQTASACAPGTDVKLVEGDFFAAGTLPLGKFDVIYSGGFIEHFTDPSPVAKRLRELCAPGGVVITTVPNLAGVNGWLQQLTDRALFNAHVVHDCASLDAGHAAGTLVRIPNPLWKALWFGLSKTRRMAEWVSVHAGVEDGGWVLAPMIGGVYQPARSSGSACGHGV